MKNDNLEFTCKVCNKVFKSSNSLAKHLRTHKLNSKSYYDTYILAENGNRCKTCGKITKYIGITQGYQKHCNARCANLDKDVLDKINAAKLPKLELMKEKSKQTRLKRYNGKYMSDDTKRKIRETTIKHYGGIGFASKILLQQCQNTLMEKYGITNVFQREDVKEKCKETKLQRYGDEYYTNSEKAKQTLLCNHGVTNVFQLQSVKDKIVQTNLERHNVAYPMQSEQIKQKSIDTCMQKYGAKMYAMSSEYKTAKLMLFKQKHDVYNEIRTRTGNILHCKCHICNKTYDIDYQCFINRSLANMETCIYCNSTNTTSSECEKELYEYIKQIYTGSIITHNRSILSGKELDIYLPEMKLAFEFDGLYWHNELYKDKMYHLNKTNDCEKLGIQLIHVFEDEWHFKKDIVKSKILSLLQLSKKIYARKCKVVILDNNCANEFLNKNSLYGSYKSDKNYGLVYDNELVAVMSFSKSKNDNEYILKRYTTKLYTTVVGGSSRLFKHFMQDNKTVTTVIGYANKRWSNGNMYCKLNFTLLNTSLPKYFYIIDKYKRLTKTEVKKLNKDYKEHDKTLHEYMLSKHCYKIYDCGSCKYVYNR